MEGLLEAQRAGDTPAIGTSSAPDCQAQAFAEPYRAKQFKNEGKKLNVDENGITAVLHDSFIVKKQVNKPWRRERRARERWNEARGEKVHVHRSAVTAGDTKKVDEAGKKTI